MQYKVEGTLFSTGDTLKHIHTDWTATAHLTLRSRFSKVIRYSIDIKLNDIALIQINKRKSYHVHFRYRPHTADVHISLNFSGRPWEYTYTQTLNMSSR